MTAITQQMIEWLGMPQDTIKEEDGKIIAGIDHFEEKNWVLVPVRSDFSQKIWKALSWFHYLKPDISNGDLLNPITAWEDNAREWYQVIWRVNNSARMPNHIDAFRDALIMAVEKNWTWETRYFPEENLKPETWDEGNALLDINN